MSRYPVHYVPATDRDNGGPTPGAVALRDWILANHGDGTFRSAGIYNYRPVRGATSPSLHGEGRAVDIGVTRSADPAGGRLAAALRADHADIGVQSIIWNRQIWSCHRDWEGWRRYSGSDPHTSHLHVELNPEAAAGLTPAILATELGGTAPMTLTEATKRLQAIVISHGPDLGATGPNRDGVDGIPGTLTVAAAADVIAYLAGVLDQERSVHAGETAQLQADLNRTRAQAGGVLTEAVRTAVQNVAQDVADLAGLMGIELADFTP